MKTGYYDLEIFPATVLTYDLYKPVIGYKQILEPSRIMCFAAKIDKKPTKFYADWDEGGRQGMLQALHDFFDEVDVVVGYNNKRFDDPWVLGELLSEGFSKPSPVKSLDLFQAVRSNTRYLSKKLDYVADRLLDDKKVDVNTLQLARECYSEDEKVRTKARRLMKKYNCQDTNLLPRVVEVMKPFLKMPHPVSDNPNSCHACGSLDLQRRGFAHTLTGKFQKFRCNSCGSWFRDTIRVETSALRAI